MAYVTPQDPNAEDTNQVSLDAPVRLAAQAPSAVGTGIDGTDMVNAPNVPSSSVAEPVSTDIGNIQMTPYSSGSGTAAPAATTAAPRASSGTFTNLSSYLNANQGGAQNLGTQVGNKISTDVNKASSDLSSANDAFRNQVAANTNKASTDYIANAVAAPKDYVNDETFAKDLSGTYGGPSSFLGTKDAQNALGSIQNAQQTAQLAGTEGGRTQLINQVSAAPLSRGGANLDQWLVQGNQPALSTVQGAADSANPLQTNYDTAVSEGDKAAQAATKGNQDLRSQILQGLTTGQSAYNNQLQSKATDLASKMNANNQAVANYLKTGTGDVGTVLPQLGMTPQALAGLQAANDAAKAKGLPGVDLSQFWTGTQSPNFDVGNVANEGDIANLNAYSHFLGNANPVLNRGLVTPGSFDFVNAGQRIADMIKTGSATGGANSTPVTTAPKVGSNTVGGYVSNANTISSSHSGSSGGSDVTSGGGSTSGGTYSPGYTVGDDGIAHMDSTGLTDGQAKALGVLAGMLTGIPALGTVGQYINNSINNANFTAAQTYNNAEANAQAKEAQAALGQYGGYTTGSDSNVGSANYTDAARAAANNVTQTPDQVTSANSPTANYAAQAEATAKLNAAIAAAQEADAAAHDVTGDYSGGYGNYGGYTTGSNTNVGTTAPTGYGADGMGPPSSAAPSGDTSSSSSSSSSSGSSGGDTGGMGGSGYNSSAASDSNSSRSDGGWGGGSGGFGTGPGSGGSDSGGSDSGGGGSPGGDKDGGYIAGPGTATSDSIPRMLSNGEYVLKASAVKALGRDFLDRLNNIAK